MATVAELVAVLRADARQFSATMEKSTAQVEAMKATSSSFSKVASAGFMVVGAAAAVGIAKAVDATVAWSREVLTLQRVTGQSAESASALLALGAEFGMTTQQMTTGLGIFEKNVINGAKGVEKYGLEVRNAQGQLLPFDTILGNVSDKFLTMKKGPEQAAFAMNVFGRSGKSLIPILRQGADGLELLKEEAKKTGLVIGQDTVDAAVALGREQRTLGESFKGLAVQIGTIFLPVVNTIITFFVKVVQGLVAVPKPVYAVVLSFLVLTGVLAAFMAVGSAVSGVWTKMIASMLPAEAETTTLAAAFTALGVAIDVSMWEVVLIVAAIAALTYVVVKNWDTIKKWGIAIAAAVGPAVVALWNGLKSAAIGLWNALKPLVGFVAGAFMQAWRALGNALASIGQSFKAVWDALAPLVQAFQALWPILKPVVELFAAFLLAPLIGALLALAYILKGLAIFFQQVADAASLFAQFIGPVLTAAVNLSIRGINAFIGILNKVIDASNRFLHTNIDHLSTIDEVTSATDDATAATDGYSGAAAKAADVIARQQAAMEALGSPIAENTKALGILQRGYDAMGGALDQFAAASGQSMDSVKQSLETMLADPTKATGDQVIAVLANMRGAYQAWHDSIVQVLGGAGSALDEFANKHKVDIGKAIGNLQAYTSSIKTFGNDIDTVHKRFGKSANDFIQWATSQGLAQSGLVASVASSSKQAGDEFIRQWKRSQDATDTLASQIQTVLGPVFDRIILWLKNVVRAIEGLPPIHLDNKQALAALDAIRAKALEIHVNLVTDLPINPRATPRTGGYIDPTGSLRHFATGGGVFGVDTVPALLQPGEFVLTKKAVDRIGVSALMAMNAGQGPSAAPMRLAPASPRASRLKIEVRPDRRRFGRDLDEDYQTRGW